MEYKALFLNIFLYFLPYDSLITIGYSISSIISVGYSLSSDLIGSAIGYSISSVISVSYSISSFLVGYTVSSIISIWWIGYYKISVLVGSVGSVGFFKISSFFLSAIITFSISANYSLVGLISSSG